MTCKQSSLSLSLRDYSFSFYAGTIFFFHSIHQTKKKTNKQTEKKAINFIIYFYSTKNNGNNHNNCRRLHDRHFCYYCRRRRRIEVTSQTTVCRKSLLNKFSFSFIFFFAVILLHPFKTKWRRNDLKCII